MYLGNRIEINIPKDAGKAEKVLVLAPAAGAPLEYISCQFILSFLNIRCQIKFGRRKGIFAISNIASVAPKRKRTLHSLKGNKDRTVLPFFRHLKIFYIAGYRIKVFRNLPRRYFVPAIPRILNICILRGIISLHLNMSRDTDICPTLAIVVLCLKPLECSIIVGRIRKLP